MAVQVSRSRHGYLAFRIFWRGRDEWIGTKLRDDGEAGKNRRRLEAKAVLVSERLEAGDELHAALLTVLGDCPPRLMPDKPAAETKPITLGEFAEWWLTHIAERERRNYWRKATSYVRNIILPILGKKTPLAEITTAKVKKLQDDLLRRRVRRTDRETGKRSIRTIKVRLFGTSSRATSVRSSSRRWSATACPRWTRSPRTFAGRGRHDRRHRRERRTRSV